MLRGSMKINKEVRFYLKYLYMSLVFLDSGGVQ